MTQPSQTQTVVLLGGTGFIGSKLGLALARQGYQIKLVSRSIRPFETSFPVQSIHSWDGTSLDPEILKDTHAIINLSGAGISDRSWTKAYKMEIMNSRVDSSRAILNAYDQILDPEARPKVWIQASAIGYYGLEDRKACDESSEAGQDFLATVSKAWEAASDVQDRPIRQVFARIGLVLGWEGGALPQLWDIYCSKLGATLGSGHQWMNWIHIDDVVSFFCEALQTPAYEGPYNLVAPEHIQNQDLHKIFCQNTPSFNFMWAPSWSVYLLLGGKSSLVLHAPKVTSTKLKDVFTFQFKSLSDAMTDLLSERVTKDAHYLKVQQWLPAHPDDLWSFISDAKNLERITPEFLKFKIVEFPETDQITLNSKITYSLRLHGIRIKWKTLIKDWEPTTHFSDNQESGPYKLWYHRHSFTPFQNGTLIEDRIEFKLPIFPLGQVALPLVRHDVESIFRYRKAAMVSAMSLMSK